MVLASFATYTLILPPCGVYLNAFEITFTITFSNKEISIIETAASSGVFIEYIIFLLSERHLNLE